MGDSSMANGNKKSLVYRLLGRICEEEFTWKKTALKHEVPEVFTRCHWQKFDGVHPMWLVYRIFVAFYFLGSFLYTVFPICRDVTEEQSKKHFIFLTNWTYLLETFQFILAFIIVAIKSTKELKSREPMTSLPWYYKLYWILNTIVISSALTVTFMFWVSVYDPVLFPKIGMSLIVHAFNSAFIILDFILSAHPVVGVHFFWPVIYAFIYLIFSIIYELSGGTGVKGIVPIYKVLDWNNHPGRAVLTSFGAFLIVLTFHFLFSFFSVIKILTKTKQRDSVKV